MATTIPTPPALATSCTRTHTSPSRADHIAADYAAGVLTLTIPVHEAAKPRNIQVTSSDRKQAVIA